MLQRASRHSVFVDSLASTRMAMQYLRARTCKLTRAQAVAGACAARALGMCHGCFRFCLALYAIALAKFSAPPTSLCYCLPSRRPLSRIYIVAFAADIGGAGAANRWLARLTDRWLASLAFEAHTRHGVHFVFLVHHLPSNLFQYSAAPFAYGLSVPCCIYFPLAL